MCTILYNPYIWIYIIHISIYNPVCTVPHLSKPDIELISLQFSCNVTKSCLYTHIFKCDLRWAQRKCYAILHVIRICFLFLNQSLERQFLCSKQKKKKTLTKPHVSLDHKGGVGTNPNPNHALVLYNSLCIKAATGTLQSTEHLINNANTNSKCRYIELLLLATSVIVSQTMLTVILQFQHWQIGKFNSLYLWLHYLLHHLT